MFSSVLMVCIGNICRSPMAEGLAGELLPGSRVESAGLAAMVGRAPEPHAQDLLHDRGIDISGIRARQITSSLIMEFELILVMDPWQAREVEKISPTARGRVFRLGHWGDFDVPDPYQQERQAFEQALERIEQGLVDLKGALRW